MDTEYRAKIKETADELDRALAEAKDLIFWEGGIVRVPPTGAPNEYITVEIQGIHDANVMWRGFPASLQAGDEVLVWEDPNSKRREVFGASGSTTTSTSSPWQKLTVAPSGGDFALLSAAITWINALPAGIAPSATRLFAVNIRGGTFVEAADVTIPQYVHVGGEGEGTVLDMGDNTLVMSADTSLQELIVTSTANNAKWTTVEILGNNVVMDDVRVIVTDANTCVEIIGYSGVELYYVTCETTTIGAVGFYISNSTVEMWDCHADDSTNFWPALLIGHSGTPSTVTTRYCTFRAASANNDVWVDANCTWQHFCCNFDPDNISINAAATETPLLHGKTEIHDLTHIQAPTTTRTVLELQTTDDNATNPILEIQNSAGAMMSEIEKDGNLNFTTACAANPGVIEVNDTRFLHTYGFRNLFIGPSAGNFTMTGEYNLAIGEGALDGLTTGGYNVAVGWDAGGASTTGTQNMLIGYIAGQAITSARENVIIGGWAGQSLTTGVNNVFIGSQAGRFTTTGSDNLYLGRICGWSNVSGVANVGIGTNVLSNATSNYNVAIGSDAGAYLTTGAQNTYIGGLTGWRNQTGSNNIFIGYSAGRSAVGNSHSSNVGIGAFALEKVTTGAENVAIGYAAGNLITTGSLNVLLGYYAGGALTTQSNLLVIGNSNTLTPLVYGEFDTWRLAFGNQYAVDKYGELAHASGYFAAIGDAQASPDSFIVRLAQASHAVNTWYILYPDGGTLPERLTIAADSAWMVDVLVIGLTQNTAQQWAYQITGVLERDNANNTTLAVQTVTTHFESDANYDAQIVADDANEALEVQVRRTGGVDYNIRWCATIRHVQASYP